MLSIFRSDYTMIRGAYIAVSFAFPIIIMFVASILLFSDGMMQSRTRSNLISVIVGVGVLYLFSGIFVLNSGITVGTPKEQALQEANIEKYDLYEGGDVVVTYKLPGGKKTIRETYENGDSRISLVDDINAKIRREDGVLYLPTKPYKEISQDTKINRILIIFGGYIVMRLFTFWMLVADE